MKITEQDVHNALAYMERQSVSTEYDEYEMVAIHTLRNFFPMLKALRESLVHGPKLRCVINAIEAADPPPITNEELAQKILDHIDIASATGKDDSSIKSIIASILKEHR